LKSKPCDKAIEKLEEAKRSYDECVKYNICPACGESLMVFTICGENQKRCTSCSNAYDNDIDTDYND